MSSQLLYTPGEVASEADHNGIVRVNINLSSGFLSGHPDLSYVDEMIQAGRVTFSPHPTLYSREVSPLAFPKTSIFDVILYNAVTQPRAPSILVFVLSRGEVSVELKYPHKASILNFGVI